MGGAGEAGTADGEKAGAGMEPNGGGAGQGAGGAPDGNGHAGAGGEAAMAAGAGAAGHESGGGGGQATAGAGPSAGAGGESSRASAGGESSRAGAGGESSTAGAGGEAAASGNEIALTPVDGWIDGESNPLGIRGAVFAFADEVSRTGLIEDFKGSNACIGGTAARVDLNCTPIPPATDCYGTFWGAAIGLNLNQAIDPGSGLGGLPMLYDASDLIGFAFELTGSAVPSSLRFKVEDASGEYCTPFAKPIKLGDNVVLFSDLIAQCWKPGGASAVGAKSGLIRLSWQVVTNSQAEIPFDYCVGNVRALAADAQ